MKRRTRALEPEPVSDVMLPQQAADYLHCSYTTIHRLLHTRGFPGFRIGSDWRFRRSDLDRWMESQTIVIVSETEPEPAKAKRGKGRPRKPKAKP